VPAQTFTLPCPHPPGSLMVVTGGLRFNALKRGIPVMSEDPSYISCSVIKTVVNVERAGG